MYLASDITYVWTSFVTPDDGIIYTAAIDTASITSFTYSWSVVINNSTIYYNTAASMNTATIISSVITYFWVVYLKWSAIDTTAKIICCIILYQTMWYNIIATLWIYSTAIIGWVVVEELGMIYSYVVCVESATATWNFREVGVVCECWMIYIYIIKTSTCTFFCKATVLECDTIYSVTRIWWIEFKVSCQNLL